MGGSRPRPAKEKKPVGKERPNVPQELSQDQNKAAYEERQRRLRGSSQIPGSSVGLTGQARPGTNSDMRY